MTNYFVITILLEKIVKKSSPKLITQKLEKAKTNIMDTGNNILKKKKRKELGLEKLNGQRKWKIQGSNATKGEGIYEGIEWLQKTLSSKK